MNLVESQIVIIINDTFRQITHKIDPHSKLIRAWELKGGISAQVTALEIERLSGQIEKMVVRQHSPVDLKHNPQIAADEFRLLQLLRSAGLATPTPYLLDQSYEIFSTPYIVIEYIEGESTFAPVDLPQYILQFTLQLASIHALDCSQHDLSFLPQQAQRYTSKLSEPPAKIDKSLEEEHIRAILAAIWPLPQHNPSVLLHGDYWPGNILWRNGELVAVIDWEDAAIGDPLIDLSNSRLEILWAFGIDAMQRFTYLYQSMNPLDLSHLPYWDLCAALRLASQIDGAADDKQREKTMRQRYHQFITRAYVKLSAP